MCHRCIIPVCPPWNYMESKCTPSLANTNTQFQGHSAKTNCMLDTLRVSPRTAWSTLHHSAQEFSFWVLFKEIDLASHNPDNSCLSEVVIFCCYRSRDQVSSSKDPRITLGLKPCPLTYLWQHTSIVCHQSGIYSQLIRRQKWVCWSVKRW